MKNAFLALCTFGIFCLFSLQGCNNDTYITNYNTVPVTTAPHLDKGCIYIATQNTYYSEGVAFWMDNTGHLQTDLGSGQFILDYRNDERNADIVIFTVLLPWFESDTLRFIARNSKFKYDQIPARGDSIYPYRGVGIVNTWNLFFVYDQEHSIMHFFNAFNGDTCSKSAVYDSASNRVNIEGGQKLLPNSVSPDPLGTNVHEWYDPRYVGPPDQQIIAYRLFWGQGNQFKNPGKLIKKTNN